MLSLIQEKDAVFGVWGAGYCSTPMTLRLHMLIGQKTPLGLTSSSHCHCAKSSHALPIDFIYSHPATLVLTVIWVQDREDRNRKQLKNGLFEVPLKPVFVNLRKRGLVQC